jgi:hypothetical protein
LAKHGSTKIKIKPYHNVDEIKLIQNWNWQLQYLNDVKKILKSQAMFIVNIEVAPPTKDLERCTDIRMKVESGDVAVRIRRGNCKFRDVTIRSYNKNYVTELDKIKRGYGSYYLYCWTANNCISEWILIDLSILRNSGLLSKKKQTIMNTDGKTGFVVFTIVELEKSKAVVSSFLK